MSTICSLPHEIIREILSCSHLEDIKNNVRVCKKWHAVIVHESFWKNLFQKHAFGKKEWEKHYGNVGQEPKLNYRQMIKILCSPCPFWKGKKVYQTHMKFILIPKTVDGKKMSKVVLDHCVRNPKEGNPTVLSYLLTEKLVFFEEIDEPYYVLITDCVVPGTKGKSFQEQQDLVTKIDPFYSIPKIMEIALGICSTHINSGSKEIYLFPAHRIVSRCQELMEGTSIAVGTFNEGLMFTPLSDSEICGAAAVRIFKDCH